MGRQQKRSKVKNCPIIQKNMLVLSESRQTARKMNTFNAQALNSALVVGNFIMLKTEIEKLNFCERTCEDNIESETCQIYLSNQGREAYYCQRYPIVLKIVLACISIVLQVIYGFIDISLVVEKQEDEAQGMDKKAIEQKMQTRAWTSFTAAVLGLFISIVNYVMAAFE